MSATEKNPTEPSEDKWAAWKTLRSPQAADEYLRKYEGITLTMSSTKEEIDEAVALYKRSW